MLSRADARGSADNIYRMWRMSLLCRLGVVTDVKKEGTDGLNIIVLDHFFNSTKKSNLISRGRLCENLTQLFDNFVVAYFLGHPVHVSRQRWLNHPQAYLHCGSCSTAADINTKLFLSYV